jgi:hypothetical protein
MAREALRGFLQVGFFIAVTGACSALLLPPESGEFVLSVCASGVGIALVAGSIAIWRLMR